MFFFFFFIDGYYYFLCFPLAFVFCFYLNYIENKKVLNYFTLIDISKVFLIRSLDFFSLGSFLHNIAMRMLGHHTLASILTRIRDTWAQINAAESLHWFNRHLTHHNIKRVLNAKEVAYHQMSNDITAISDRNALDF